MTCQPIPAALLVPIPKFDPMTGQPIHKFDTSHLDRPPKLVGVLTRPILKVFVYRRYARYSEPDLKVALKLVHCWVRLLASVN